MRELKERMASAMVASCSCGTKTPNIHAHEPICRYRVLSEALARIEELEGALRKELVNG